MKAPPPHSLASVPACSVGGLPSQSRSLRNAASRAIFFPPASAAPLSASSQLPTPSPFPLKCLQACLQAGSPLPHRTTSVTSLTTRRSRLDLLKDPEGEPAPFWLPGPASGVGFRPVAEREEKDTHTQGKVLVPTPTLQPPAHNPSSTESWCKSSSPGNCLGGWGTCYIPLLCPAHPGGCALSPSG